MFKKARSPREFVSSRTVHTATLLYCWAQDKTHDTDYHLKVQDSVAAKLKQVLAKYDSVSQDTRFCCQWEGLELYGEDRYQVEAAANELARHLMRFKGVVPLGL